MTTVYKSQRFLDGFVAQVHDAVVRAGIEAWELVFVIDGPTDDSPSILREKHAQLPNIRIVELARNFGHHAAMLCGLRAARGELVFLIDCDLEVSPSVLCTFLDVMKERSVDVVFGVQNRRKGGVFERVSGGVFWRLFNLLSDVHVPPDILTERLMTRRYIDALTSLEDRNLFLAGMMVWTGFPQIGVPVDKVEREGRSSYTPLRRVALAIEAVTSFSSAPLRLMLTSGMILLAGCMLSAMYVLALKLLFPERVLAGFTSLIIAILFLCGVILFSSGVLGLYIARIFRQTQGRPAYIVKSEYPTLDQR